MTKPAKNSAKSFWLSIPGFLTALAALITAVTGLYAALHRAPVAYPTSESTASRQLQHVPVHTVRIRSSTPSGTLVAYGFVTPKGFVVAGTETFRNATQISLSWMSEGLEQRRPAQVVRTGAIAPSATLLQIVGPPLNTPGSAIRVSGTLRIGEKVARYVGPDDIAFGTVTELNAQREMPADAGSQTMSRLLITTKISGIGDLGAPIVDSDGKIVAMLLAEATDETICIPIEDIKASFPEAF